MSGRTRLAARGVFISYSRVNGEVVSIAAKLLRAGGATVFQDVVDIGYGADWQEALAKAIRQCERVLVFWSLAASSSEWVEREWRMALQAGKRIVPMLLDKTPLPKELSTFNGMPELMQLLMLVKQPAPASVQPRPAPARARSYLLPGLGVACGAVFCAVFLFYGVRQAGRPGDVIAAASNPGSAAAIPPPPLDAFQLPSMGWLPTIVVALFVLSGVVAWYLFGRRKGGPNARLVREIGPLFTSKLFD